MRVLRLTAEGLTTSFRYPHFIQGVHPTFEMPPPATIYGHICSALGSWIDPEGIEFAYHFTYQSKFDDVEHIHVLTPASGKLPGTNMPKVLGGKVNPFKRTILFQPKLILYINKPEFEPCFRSPRYPVALGRSQDLFTYTSVGVVDLVCSNKAYFEHTLAPYNFALYSGSGYAVLMPRFLDYARLRTPAFSRFMVLHRRVYAEELIKYESSTTKKTFWVDPDSALDKGAHLGLFFHSFAGERYDTDNLAGMA